MTIRVKAIEQYFPVLLFIMLYKVVHTFESVNEILKCDDSNEIKATEQYFPVVLFIMLYRVVLILSLWMKSSNVAIQMKAIEQYTKKVSLAYSAMHKR